MVDMQREMSINFIRLHFIDPQMNIKNQPEWRKKREKQAFLHLLASMANNDLFSKNAVLSFRNSRKKKLIHSRFTCIFVDKLNWHTKPFAANKLPNKMS